MRLDFLVYAGSLLWCRKIPLAIQFLVLVIQHFWAGVVVIVRELGLYQLIPSSSVARYKKQEEALEEYPCGSDVKPMKEKSIWVWGGGKRVCELAIQGVLRSTKQWCWKWLVSNFSQGVVLWKRAASHLSIH